MLINPVVLIFNFRWLWWVLGLLTFALFFLKKTIKQQEASFLRHLSVLSGLYFCLGATAKWTQLWTWQLHGQDFWLFVDILEQLKQGAAFLTRFAPQAQGFVQHGIVHPMFSWATLLPLASLVGSKNAALLFNPLCLSLAGFFLGLCLRPRLGAGPSLAITGAFFVSSQLGKILMYEVHPEAAYPFAVFLWLWVMKWQTIPLKKAHTVTHATVHWPTLCLVTIFGFGIKEDSFLVFLPWIFLILLQRGGSSNQRKAAGLSLFLGLLISGAQIYAIRQWERKNLGPTLWAGSLVQTELGLNLVKGVAWDGVESIWSLVKELSLREGSLSGIMASSFSFLLSRPWLSLVILAPWVILKYEFWILILPLVLATVLIRIPLPLWNYYSAPFLASFWMQASSIPKKNLYFVYYMLIASCFLGNSTIVWYLPSKKVQAVQRRINKLLPCLGEHGIVASQLIGELPLEKIWSDRVPPQSEKPESINSSIKLVDFVLFMPETPSWEMGAEKSRALYKYLKESSAWEQVGENCQAVKKSDEQSGSETVVLFLKKTLKKEHPSSK